MNVDTNADGAWDETHRYVEGNGIHIFEIQIFDRNNTLLRIERPAFRAAGHTWGITAVDPVANTLTIAGHGLRSGSGTFLLRTAGTLPGGTTHLRTYVVHTAPTVDTFTLWDSFANDGLGAPVDITDVGVGVHTLVRAYRGFDQWDRDNYLFDGFHINHYVVNAVDSTRLLFAAGFIYESTDRFETLSAATEPGTITVYTAAAYGGRIGVANHADVIYSAEGNNIHVRSHGAAAFTVDRIPEARQIRDLALDPRDYRTAYAVTDVGVFRRDRTACDALTGVCPWRLISQNLFNANLQTIVFAAGTESGSGSRTRRTSATCCSSAARSASPAPSTRHRMSPGSRSARTCRRRSSPTSSSSTTTRLRSSTGGSPATTCSSSARRAVARWTLEHADVALGQAPVLTVTGTAAADQSSLPE